MTHSLVRSDSHLRDVTHFRMLPVWHDPFPYETWRIYIAMHCNALRHTATHCVTLHRTAPHCTTLHLIATHCTTLHRSAAQWNTVHHTASHCNTPQHTATHRWESLLRAEKSERSLFSDLLVNSPPFDFADRGVLAPEGTARRDTLIREKSLRHQGDMTPSFLCRAWCARTRVCCVVWLIHTWDMTHWLRATYDEKRCVMLYTPLSCVT